jgi:hypothetical protein
LSPISILYDIHLQEDLGDALVLKIVELIEVSAYLSLYLVAFFGRDEKKRLWKNQVKGVAVGSAVPIVVRPLLDYSGLSVDDDLLENPLSVLRIES